MKDFSFSTLNDSHNIINSDSAADGTVLKTCLYLILNPKETNNCYKFQLKSIARITDAWYKLY